MRRVDSRWNRSGWLPELELVSWPRLVEFRVRHEAAVAALEASPKDPAAIENLCDIVEAACVELAEHWDEIEAILEAEGEKLRGPEPDPQPGPPEIVRVSELNRQAKAMERRQARHRAKVRDRRRAVEGDERALFAVNDRVLAPRILADAAILPSAVFEARRVRNEVADGA